MTAIVERVVDGDTIDVRAAVWINQEIRVAVRVEGVDAPELFRPRCAAERAAAEKARDFVKGFFQIGRQSSPRYGTTNMPAGFWRGYATPPAPISARRC